MSAEAPDAPQPNDLGFVTTVGDVGRSNLARIEAALECPCGFQTSGGLAWAALHLPNEDAEVRIFSVSNRLAELVRGNHLQTAYLDGRLTEVTLIDGFYLAPGIVFKVMNTNPYAELFQVDGPGAESFVNTRAASSLWPALPPKWSDAICKDIVISSAQGVSNGLLH